MSGARSRKERALQQVQTVIQTALLLGLYHLAEARVLTGVNDGKRCSAALMACPSRRIRMQTPGIIEQGYANCGEELHSF